MSGRQRDRSRAKGGPIIQIAFPSGEGGGTTVCAPDPIRQAYPAAADSSHRLDEFGEEVGGGGGEVAGVEVEVGFGAEAEVDDAQRA